MLTHFNLVSNAFAFGAWIKAINAAIEIRNKLNEFNIERNLPDPLNVHIGINTGTVIAGPLGSSKKKE